MAVVGSVSGGKVTISSTQSLSKRKLSKTSLSFNTSEGISRPLVKGKTNFHFRSKFSSITTIHADTPFLQQVSQLTWLQKQMENV